MCLVRTTFEHLIHDSMCAMKRAFLLLVISTFTFSAHAQVPFGKADSFVQRAGLQIGSIDFRFDGNAPAELEFTFTNPTYGVYYSRQEITFSYAVGTQTLGSGEKLSLTDATISGWIPLFQFGEGGDGAFTFFIPAGLSSDFRRITRTQGSTEIDAFEYTGVAAGAGVGVGTPIAGGYFLSTALPLFGIASQSFGNSTDTSALLTAGAEWISPQVAGRFGVSLGYGYRWQKWYSDVGRISGHSYDFVGTRHEIKVGLSF